MSDQVNWISPEHIIAELNLKPRNNSPEEIIRCLRDELASIHPDKSGGTFQNTEAEQRWHKLTSARDYMEGGAPKSLAVIPISQVSELIRSLREVTAEPLERRSADFVSEARRSIRQATFLPKITSGALSAICTFLIAASGFLKGNPLFGVYVSTKEFQGAFLILLFYSGLFFVMVWLNEGKMERYLEWLLTSEGSHSVLAAVVRESKQTEMGATFTFEEVIGTLETKGRRSLKPFGRRLDRATVEKSAKLIIERLKEERLISESPKGRLQQSYEVSKEIRDELVSLPAYHSETLWP